MNRERVRRSGVTATIAAFALIALVACGGESVSEVEHEVTRVPTMSDAAAQATSDAASAATVEAAGTPVAASPAADAAGAATPVSAGAASPGAATPVEEAATAEVPAAGQAAAEPLTVVSHDIFFEPKEFSVPEDTDVPVSLPNEGVTLHNFSIDAINLSVDIDPGATEEAVINLPAGTYEFYCNVPGHKAAGMFGTVTVGG